MKKHTVAALIATFLLLLTGSQAQNLVTNPSFESGNVGFTTAYTYSPSNGNPQSTYAIVTNPRLIHNLWASMGDHSTGIGNMMVVNGATVGNVVVWSQQLIVEPNQVYLFSAWAANVLASGGDQSTFVFRVNGVTLQPQVLLPPQAAQWQNYSTNWSSGNSTTALLEIIFISTFGVGNDTALDDLAFRKTNAAPVNVNIFNAALIEWDSSFGVDYQIQSSTDLNVWVAEGSPLAGTGSLMTYSEKIITPRKFFRVIGLNQ